MATVHKLETKAAASPARQRLQDILDQRAQHQRKIQEAKAAYDRLTSVIEIAVETRTALTEFDDRSAEDTAAWARSPLRGEMPSVDSNARQKLLTDHTIAQENADAALAARKQFEQAMHAESLAIEALKIPEQHAVADILIEEATGPALDELRRAVIFAVEKQTRVKACFDALVTIAHSGDAEAMKPVFAKLQPFSEALQLAAAPPAPDHTPHRSAWLKLAADLPNNPNATLTISAG